VPVHAVVTAGNPMVRFIGSDDMATIRLFGVWLQTLPKWHQSTPYLFLHTPDIAQAPELVAVGRSARALPEVGGTVNSAANLSFLISCYLIGAI
jgi:uncharacterized protein YecE (DUF72 family)